MELDTLLSMIRGPVVRVGRVDPRDNNGIGVSTVLTMDEGYETALLDANGVHVAERYPDAEQALKRHKVWVRWARRADGKAVSPLGPSFCLDLPGETTLEAIK